MLISYDAYRVFYTVARLGSFTKAAGTLLSSQPNLTRTIRNLESALGCTLFVRSNRGAVLTPEGEKLFARVSVACEQIQAGEEELASDRSLQSGVVSIGASETALHGFLLPVLGAFHRAHPGIRLRIANHSTPQAFSALRNGLVDVAVVTSPTADTSGLHIEPLGQFEEVPVCGPSLMHLCGQKLTLADLSAYPFISLGRETASYAFAYNLFAENGAAFSPDIEVATSDQILPLVRLDLGVAFLPEAFAAPALQKGEIGRLTLAETIPPRQLLMARRSGQALSIAVNSAIASRSAHPPGLIPAALICPSQSVSFSLNWPIFCFISPASSAAAISPSSARAASRIAAAPASPPRRTAFVSCVSAISAVSAHSAASLSESPAFSPAFSLGRAISRTLANPLAASARTPPTPAFW